MGRTTWGTGPLPSPDAILLLCCSAGVCMCAVKTVIQESRVSGSWAPRRGSEGVGARHACREEIPASGACLWSLTTSNQFLLRAVPFFETAAGGAWCPAPPKPHDATWRFRTHAVIADPSERFGDGVSLPSAGQGRATLTFCTKHITDSIMVDTKSGNHTDVQTLFRASQGGAAKASEHKGGWAGPGSADGVPALEQTP